ncbi:hypothetical protein ACOSP7_006889 [Xanthoceras sorbifolium]
MPDLVINHHQPDAVAANPIRFAVDGGSKVENFGGKELTGGGAPMMERTNGIQLQMVTPDSNLVQLSETVCTVRDSLQAKNNKPIMRQNLVNLVTVTYVTSIKGMDTGLVLENKEAQVKQTQQENQDVLMRPKWRRLSRGVTKQRRMGWNRNKFGKHGHDAWPEFSHTTLKKARTSAQHPHYGQRMGRSRFHFEKCWSLEDGCMEIVKDCWNSVGHNPSLNGVVSSLINCADQLQEWNRMQHNQFRNQFKKAKEVVHRANMIGNLSDWQKLRNL